MKKTTLLLRDAIVVAFIYATTFSSLSCPWETAGVVGPSSGGTPIATINGNSDGTHSWIITSLVQGWIDGTITNNGIMVGSQDGGGNRTIDYYSRETTLGTPPILRISYSETNTTNDFIASKDTYITLKSPDNNYGACETLIVDREDNDLHRILLEFDLSSISSTTIISSAELRLYTEAGENMNVSVFQIGAADAWDEGNSCGSSGFANWNNRAAAGFFEVSKVVLGPPGGNAQLGDPVSFSITVTNTGLVDLNQLRVEDVYDGSLLSFTGAGPPPDDPTNGTLVWTNVGPLAVGASTSLVVNLVATNSNAGVLSTNSAVVLYTPPPSCSSPMAKTSSVPYTVIDPQIVVSKNPSTQQVLSLGTATFTISVTNSGDVVLSNVTVNDPLAPDCDLMTPSLAVGASTSYVCTVTNVTSDFTNMVIATGSPPFGPDVAASDQAFVDWIPAVELSVHKSASPEPAVAGAPLVYTITVTNAGPEPATGVRVTELLPANVSYVSDVPSQGIYNSGSGVWDVGGLASAGSATLQITVQVDSGAQ